MSNQEIILSTDKLPTGPKCKYKPEYCDMVIEAASKGGHIPAQMIAIGVKSKDTWYRWQKDYPEFREAVEYAKVVSQALLEGIGMKGMMGEIPNFNATTYALVMNNKFKEDYKRDSSGSGPTEITFNTLNLTSDQITDKIAQKLEKLKSLGVVLNVDEREGVERIT
jgi:hypothetical protein